MLGFWFLKSNIFSATHRYSRFLFFVAISVFVIFRPVMRGKRRHRQKMKVAAVKNEGAIPPPTVVLLLVPTAVLTALLLIVVLLVTVGSVTVASRVSKEALLPARSREGSPPLPWRNASPLRSAAS